MHKYETYGGNWDNNDKWWDISPVNMIKTNDNVNNDQNKIQLSTSDIIEQNYKQNIVIKNYNKTRRRLNK